MKKLLTTLGLFAFLTIPTQAFAWTYDGIGSLNPFTNFGRNNQCGCEKVEKCKKPKLTKCEKLHGVKIKREKGTVCGCAASMKVYYKEYPTRPTCNECQRTFD